MSQTFYAALVLAGGASYGIISTLVKLSYRSGFSINDVSSIQYFLGFFCSGPSGFSACGDSPRKRPHWPFS